jgi:hypothetical protein
MSACAVSMRKPSRKDGKRNDLGWNGEKRMKGIEEKKGNEGLAHERICLFPSRLGYFQKRSKKIDSITL